MSNIGWTHETWNIVWGCKGTCNYCYAKQFSKRFAARIAGKEAEFITSNPHLKESKSYDQVYKETFEKLSDFKPVFLYSQFMKNFKKSTKLVSVDSMSDIAFWDLEWIIDLLFIIESTPQLIFQILTKFPEKIRYIDFPENVWLGISAENQRNYNDRLHELLRIKAGKHFVSFEPLHSQIDIDYMIKVIGRIKISNEINNRKDYTGSLDWVIVGGQSIKNTTPLPMFPGWVEKISTDCRKFNIPFFFKGWGHWTPYKPINGNNFRYVDSDGKFTDSFVKNDAVKMWKTNKKQAGRKLNGKEYNEFPELT